MKKFVKYFFLLSFIFIITGCNDTTKYLNTLTYDNLKEKVDNKEDFVVIVTKEDCSHCKQFHPIFAAAVNDAKYSAFELVLSDMTEDEYNDFHSAYTVSGTPTIMFFKDGLETSVLNRMTGSNHSKADIKNRLAELGYIK